LDKVNKSVKLGGVLKRKKKKNSSVERLAKHRPLSSSIVKPNFKLQNKKSKKKIKKKTLPPIKEFVKKSMSKPLSSKYLNLRKKG